MHTEIGVATRIKDGLYGVQISADVRVFSSPKRPDQVWGPSSLLLNGYRVSLPGVKRPGRDGNHSPHLARRLRTSGALPLLPLYSLIARTRTTSHLYVHTVRLASYVESKM